MSLDHVNGMAVYEMGIHYGANIGRQIAHEIGCKFGGIQNHTGMYNQGRGKMPVINIGLFGSGRAVRIPISPSRVDSHPNWVSGTNSVAS